MRHGADCGHVRAVHVRREWKKMNKWIGMTNANERNGMKCEQTDGKRKAPATAIVSAMAFGVRKQ